MPSEEPVGADAKRRYRPIRTVRVRPSLSDVSIARPNRAGCSGWARCANRGNEAQPAQNGDSSAARTPGPQRHSAAVLP